MKKYPRTYHLSFSPELHSDDKTISKVYENEILRCKHVILFKMDGGNCCIKPNIGVFARSHSTPTMHPTFDYIKNIHYYAKLHLLNPKYNYFGENMYGIHSIEYPELTDYFYVFNILDTETNEFLSWDEVEEECKRVGYNIVPYYDEDSGRTSEELEEEFGLVFGANKEFFKPFGTYPEGFVVRKSGRFKAEDFSKSVTKYVRQGHVQTDDHWSKNWKAAKIV